MAVTITRTAWIDDDGTGTTGTVINNAVKTALYNDIDGALAKVAQLAGGNTFTVGPHIFNTGGVERLRVATAGQILVGLTAPVGFGQLCVAVDLASGVPLAIQNLTTVLGGTLVNFINSVAGVAGAIIQNGQTSVAYNVTSDARLKDDAGRALDLAALRAVVVHDFAWKADGRADRGVFAQDAHAVFPRAVTPGTDDRTETGTLARPWMTDYSKFVPDLIVGWQQHDAELAELRALLTTEGL